MAKIFISHSSKDKDFVRQLARDLADLGHSTWLDEEQITVGDSITSAIQDGLADARYVVVVLSKHAVQSGWVEREWQAKYWSEITTRRKQILPVLVDDCDIPTLLEDRLYADFRGRYAIGLVKLTAAISPTLAAETITAPTEAGANSCDAATLLATTHSRSTPLSQCIAQALPIAEAERNQSLREFCKDELIGWNLKDRDVSRIPAWRRARIWVSTEARLNLQYWGFTSHSDIMEYVADDPAFRHVGWPIPDPIGIIERNAAGEPGILITMLPQWLVIPDSPTPDGAAYACAQKEVFQTLLEQIRAEFTKRLLPLVSPQT